MTTPELDAMISAITTTTGGIESLAGGNPESLAAVAQEWIDAGFTTKTARAWWVAGAFDAARTAALRDAGVKPHQCVTYHPDHGTSWAYAVSNCDATVAQAVAELAE